MQPSERILFLLCTFALSHSIEAFQCFQKIKQSWHEYKTRVPTRMLAAAVCENDIAQVKEALQLNGDPMASMPQDIVFKKHTHQTGGENILDHAIEYGYFDIVKAVLEVLPPAMLQENVEPLINIGSDFRMLKLLLKAGMDFNKKSLNYFMTPPMHAALARRSKIVQLYYALGVDIAAHVSAAKLEWAFCSRELQPFIESGLRIYKKRLNEYQKSLQTPVHELFVQVCAENYFPKDCSNIIIEYAVEDAPVMFGNILDDDFEMPIATTEETKEAE